MTSLRTFQTEIDEISHREVAKQRANAAAERAKLEKDAKKPTLLMVITAMLEYLP